MQLLRKLGLPLIVAAAAFSYAVATSPVPLSGASRSSTPTASGRSVGSPLQFTTPFLQAGTDARFPTGGNTPTDPQGFDLGDALQNQPVRRVITATGGEQPYSYTLTPNLDLPSFGTAVLPSLSPIGLLSGNVSAAGSFIRFNIILTDFLATQRTGVFFLRLFTAPTTFRFAQDRLPFAVQGTHYYTDLSTIGGVAPITYRVVPSSVVGNGTPTIAAGARLEDVGLSLSPDGILYGRPLVGGTIQFDVTATDASGATATGRGGARQLQSFALTVNASAQARSELATVQCAIRGSLATNGKDSFSYTGLLDSRAETPPSLAGSTLTLRIGQTSVSGTFNAKGKVKTTLPGNQNFTASLSSARLSVKLNNATLTDAIGARALNGKSTLNTIIGLELVSFRTSDALQFATQARGGKYSLNYALSKRGQALAGAFQVISVHGSDGLTGSPIQLALPLKGTTPKPSTQPDGDSWDTTFIAVPRFGIEGGKSNKDVYANATSATIRIGSGFSQQMSLTQKNVKLEFRATGKDAGVFRLQLNPMTCVNRLQTNTISEDDTGISPAIFTKDLTTFPLGLDFTGYSGESGKTMAPDRSAWSQR